MTRSSGSPPRPSSPLADEAGAAAGRDDAHVRAMTVVPGQKGTAGLEAFPDPGMQYGALLVRGMAVGVCGTDREIAEGAYGVAPSGEARLVIGHESLGEVLEAPLGARYHWLGALITCRVPLTSWTEVPDRQPEDIKVVVNLTA
jgi:threonine dehydrogenase-like Zn-dependent dehydrogenase